MILLICYMRLEMSETPQQKKSLSRMPDHSVFFEKVVPVLLALMGLLTLTLILFAVGVLLGIVHF